MMMETLQRLLPVPLGYVFYPTDEQMVEFYLYHKIVGQFNPPLALPVIDLYGHEPWEIWQQLGGIDGQDLYFFTNLKRKKSRVLRKVGSNGGTWSGENSPIPLFLTSNPQIKTGSVKRFHYQNAKNPPPPHTHGDFSWILYEYALDPSVLPPPTSQLLDPHSFVACKIRKKNTRQQ